MQCTAKSKQSGQQCKRNAAPNQTKCAMHGAKAPQNVAAAERRKAEAEAVEWVLANVKDAPPLESLREVYDELLRTAGVARAWSRVLEGRVSELESLGYAGITGEQVKAEVVLFERSMDRAMKVYDLIARLNLDERKQVLSERDGVLVAQVIRAILDALHLTPEQQSLVPRVVPEQLRLLTSEGGA